MARFYHLNPFALTGPQRLVLEANMDAVWAEEVLRDRLGSLSPEAVRALKLLATGSQAEADDAYADALAEEMRRKAAQG